MEAAPPTPPQAGEGADGGAEHLKADGNKFFARVRPRARARARSALRAAPSA